MPPPPPYIAPIAIDPVGFDTKPGTFYNNFPMQNGAWITPSGKMYTILTDQSLVAPKVHAFKSTDSGLTWNEVGIAPLFSPQALIYQSCFDGASKIFVSLADGQDVISTSSIRGVEFDCATDSWGAVSGQLFTAFLANPIQCAYRSSGEVVLIIAEDTAVPFNVIFEFVTYNGGAWSVPLDITANALAVMVAPLFPTGGALGCNMCADSAGAVHVFFAWLDNAVNEPFFYQQVTPGNAVGTFVQLPVLGAGVLDTGTYGNVGSTPLPGIAGNNVVVPVAGGNGVGNPELALLVGTPLAAPVFTLFPVIDPGFPNPAGPGSFDQPAAVLDVTSGVLQVSYSPDFAILRYLQTTDFVTWVFAGATAFDMNVSKIPPGFTFIGQTVFQTIPDVLGIEFRATVPSNHAQQQRFFLPFISVPVVIRLNAQAFPSTLLPDPTKRC
jgi:hypothetical protein